MRQVFAFPPELLEKLAVLHIKTFPAGYQIVEKCWLVTSSGQNILKIEVVQEIK